MNILECTANGAGACRNESMILDLTAERDAARADCATLHKMLDETVSERDAALRNYQNARIVYEVVIDERDVARAALLEVLAILKSGRSTGRTVIKALYAAEDVIMAVLDK